MLASTVKAVAKSHVPLEKSLPAVVNSHAAPACAAPAIVEAMAAAKRIALSFMISPVCCSVNLVVRTLFTISQNRPQPVSPVKGIRCKRRRTQRPSPRLRRPSTVAVQTSVGKRGDGGSAMTIGVIATLRIQDGKAAEFEAFF